MKEQEEHASDDEEEIQPSQEGGLLRRHVRGDVGEEEEGWRRRWQLGGRNERRRTDGKEDGRVKREIVGKEVNQLVEGERVNAHDGSKEEEDGEEGKP